MKTLLLALLCLFIAACGTTYSNKASHTQSERSRLQAKADAGDAVAQYQLGNSWCCGDSGFFSTKEAIYWWCQAARQGNPDARRELEARGELGCVEQE